MLRSPLALLAFVALLLASTSFVRAGDPTDKLVGVHDLDVDTFDKHVNGGKLALVEFYAPWCGHCKTLVPAMKALGAAVAADASLGSRVVVAKVDADLHRELGQRFGVSGFPTVKVFRRGRAVTAEAAEDYNGPRAAEGMLAHLRQLLAEDRGFARVAALDAVVAAETGALKTAAALSSLAEKLEGAAAGLKDEAERASGELYAAYAAKAAAKGGADGGSYFAKEHARLERMLGSGSVGGGKAAEISRKLSVLSAFLPDEDGAAAAATA